MQIAQAWHELYEDQGKQVAIPGRRFRASESGYCARSIAYSVHQRDTETKVNAMLTEKLIDVDAAVEAFTAVAPTNPPTIADSWRMGLGTIVHDRLEQPIKRAFPGAEVETTIDLSPSIDGSAHIDLVVTLPVIDDGTDTGGAGKPYVIVVELKTINGFGFKSTTTSFKNGPEGPRLGHVLQGAVMAKVRDADELVVGYLSTELLSPAEAKRQGVDEVGRFAAEWTFTRDEYMVYADAEAKRVTKLLSIMDEAGRPDAVPRQIPELPAKARIVNPLNGMWTVEDETGSIVDSGTTWNCDYCRWRDRCVADG